MLFRMFDIKYRKVSTVRSTYAVAIWRVSLVPWFHLCCLHIFWKISRYFHLPLLLYNYIFFTFYVIFIYIVRYSYVKLIFHISLSHFSLSKLLCLLIYILFLYHGLWCPLSFIIIIIIINIIIIVTGLFVLVILLNQQWSPLLRLQASHCSTFRIMCDVPSIAVFCGESIECFPGDRFQIFP